MKKVTILNHFQGIQNDFQPNNHTKPKQTARTTAMQSNFTYLLLASYSRTRFYQRTTRLRRHHSTERTLHRVPSTSTSSTTHPYRR